MLHAQFHLLCNTCQLGLADFVRGPADMGEKK